jgi:Eco29kI restriction endonuclease
VTGRSSSSADGEFKLSITRALADQLAEALEKLHPAPLTKDRVDKLQKRAGVYEIFIKKEKAYVGKASKDLPSRLTNHLKKLSGRSGINLDQVEFQCLYVDEDLEASAPEKMLIKKYRDQGTIPWNTNGFGNKDPGRNRDNSLVKAKHFDAIYPINLDLPLSPPQGNIYSISDYLQAVKILLPFNLRYDSRLKKKRVAHEHPTLEFPRGLTTVRAVVQKAIDVLPEGWQATALPGYIILYEENKPYESARVSWRKINGRTTELTGPNRLDEDGEVEDEASDDEDE